MFDPTFMWEMLKVEPGHGLVQTFLLLMIWMSSMGVKKEIAALKEAFQGLKSEHEMRFNKIEMRIDAIEKGK